MRSPTRARTLVGALAGTLMLSMLAAVPASAAPTRYEAENATISQGILETTHTGFSGTAYVNGDNIAGSYTEFTINAAAAGTATIVIRYSNGTTLGRPADVAVNGTVASANRPFDSTTNWDTWANSTLTAPVNAGSNTIRLTATSANGNPNLDYIDVDVAATPPPPSGNEYQAENATISQGVVESNHLGFTGTGFVNGDNVTGSYTEFNVNAATAGKYDLVFRYSNGTTTDRPGTITVNGTAVASNVSFPSTVDWDTWVDKTITANLAAGSNLVRITSTTVNGNPNLDKLTANAVTPPPPSNEYQAEDATISQGVVESNHLGFTGTGFVNGDNVAGSYTEFNVTAATAGNYSLVFRYSNGTTIDRPGTITVNGTAVASNVSFPSTTNWDTWVDKTITAGLTAGSNLVRITSTTVNGNPNLDKLSTSAPADSESPTPPSNLHVVGDVRPNAVDLAWDPSTDNVGVSLYKVYNGGNVLATVGGNVTSTTVPNLTANTQYIITVLAYDAAGNPSQASNPVNITTPPSNDTTPPSTPANLRVTNTTANTITLQWNASTDNIGVTGYNVYKDGAKFATVPDTTATVDGLTSGTTYQFSVEAFDANNNVSPRSANVPGTPGGSAGGGDPIYDKDVNTAMDLPWGITWLPDGSALVAERDRFEITRVTLSGQRTVVGKITEAVTTTGEGGLLGLAASPNFATDHYIYAFHTAASDNRVVRFKYENGAIGAREPLVTGIAKNKYHNGGRIKFGPDGYLYITTGDGQDGNRAQDLNSLNGKILRVTTTGAGAPGNPFPSAPRVYSLGHRNPQGIAWDSQGRLWEAEFGDSTWDELNLIQPGKNYGWPNCEGKCTNSAYVNPVQQWDVASASPSGIEIVNDWIYMAAVRGERLWVMHINGNTTDTPRAFFSSRWGRLRTVTKTPDGGLWLTSTNNDKSGGTPSTLDNVIVRLKFPPPALSLTSTAFANNGTIPIKYTCQQDHVAGNDISPPLAWANPPAGTQSYAIELVDTANSNKHWVIWDIPASKSSLPEGLGLGYNVPNQSPAKQKAMSTGDKSLQYFGPCPGGSSHKYEFTLYALNVATLPGVSSSSSVAAVETALLANDIASVKLAGNSSAAV
ncbi:YbhB/YbcL family Raf kinase inhibitor-like protein [Planotetraspora sp. A-T 1434]|uniref:YbhB/YbcL family Raf kinase inhibitor-like protein n=1 Tax=Planotetraspora sp. A-T 1434 TaxID=2979219 RepID=UPI0021C0C79B|nr:YbhB/YbcL family Raf kinase inhibitor-like protein [Planotetraspora sp. A-T 1434]MCT9931409.1 YbhB/YbcL family Raf kinase inhibitor-like protein [Planotetraspora sp. A-T 1434]